MLLPISVLLELSTILNTDNNVCNAMDVYHEPFSQPYYYNEKDQQSTRFSPIDDTPSFEEVVNDIKNSAQNCQYVFSKDMAYYTKNRMSINKGVTSKGIGGVNSICYYSEIFH